MISYTQMLLALGRNLWEWDKGGVFLCSWSLAHQGLKQDLRMNRAQSLVSPRVTCLVEGTKGRGEGEMKKRERKKGTLRREENERDHEKEQV